MSVRLEFLGTGTSQGVPVISCQCDVCKSADSRDKRLRASVYVEMNGTRILVDCGPDFRTQMLRSDIGALDAILLTHHHKDHTGGLDDTRALRWRQGWTSEIYCEQRTLDELKVQYDYAFRIPRYPGAPEWNMHIIDDKPFDIENAHIIPIRGFHDDLPVLGFRFGDIAYLTDMSRVPESEFEKLKGLRACTINCVQRPEHHSHMSLQQAIDFLQRVGAKESYITHISHRLPRHADFDAELPENIHPAYDGLVLTSNI